MRTLRAGKASNQVMGKIDKFLTIADLNVSMLDRVGIDIHRFLCNNALLDHVHSDINHLGHAFVSTKIAVEVVDWAVKNRKTPKDSVVAVLADSSYSVSLLMVACALLLLHMI
jgi:hypothetical protein